MGAQLLVSFKWEYSASWAGVNEDGEEVGESQMYADVRAEGGRRAEMRMRIEKGDEEGGEGRCIFLILIGGRGRGRGRGSVWRG